MTPTPSIAFISWAFGMGFALPCAGPVTVRSFLHSLAESLCMELHTCYRTVLYLRQSSIPERPIRVIAWLIDLGAECRPVEVALIGNDGRTGSVRGNSTCSSRLRAWGWGGMNADEVSKLGRAVCSLGNGSTSLLGDAIPS